MRCNWSVCRAKELRIPCQTGVFGVDIQLTQKELSDYLNDVFWIELLKAFKPESQKMSLFIPYKLTFSKARPRYT